MGWMCQAAESPFFDIIPVMRLLALALCAVFLAACYGSGDNERVNGSVDIAVGQPLADASTVNGAVHVEPGAAVKAASTVNGSITIGDRASAASATTVNGSITLGADARVSGDLKTVNGAFTLQHGANVGGELRNVNGKFELDGARVGKGIRTTNGDIDVGAGSRVEGGIEYDASTGFSVSFTHHVPRIVIGPGAVIQGPLKFGREVRLYVSDRAQTGPVTGATPISFSGDQPPAGQ